MESGANAASTSVRKREVEEIFKRSKVDFLRRRIIDFQRLFDALAQLSDGDAYLLLDDLLPHSQSRPSQGDRLLPPSCQGPPSLDKGRYHTAPHQMVRTWRSSGWDENCG